MRIQSPKDEYALPCFTYRQSPGTGLGRHQIEDPKLSFFMTTIDMGIVMLVMP